MLNREALASYLHQQIPASRLLEVGVQHCSENAVELQAPLEPNINHKNTAFGGSLAVLAILAGWSLVFMRLNGVKNEIVIQQSAMSYLKAVNGPFTATSLYQPSAAWTKFERSFERRGRGRIQVESRVFCGDEIVANFSGTYVAFNMSLG